MKHSIEITQDGNSVEIINGLTKKQAIAKTKELVYNDGKNYNFEIFISFFRKSDNQHGYLNCGGYATTGQSWNN